jgi:hypothetical protein
MVAAPTWLGWSGLHEEISRAEATKNEMCRHLKNLLRYGTCRNFRGHDAGSRWMVEGGGRKVKGEMRLKSRIGLAERNRRYYEAAYDDSWLCVPRP